MLFWEWFERDVKGKPTKAQSFPMSSLVWAKRTMQFLSNKKFRKWIKSFPQRKVFCPSSSASLLRRSSVRTWSSSPFWRRITSCWSQRRGIEGCFCSALNEANQLLMFWASGKRQVANWVAFGCIFSEQQISSEQIFIGKGGFAFRP